MRFGSMPGSRLLESDFRNLESCWISRELAEQAMLQRVTSDEGATIVRQNRRGDYSGIVFPYFMPGGGEVREYFLVRVGIAAVSAHRSGGRLGLARDYRQNGRTGRRPPVPGKKGLRRAERGGPPKADNVGQHVRLLFITTG